MKRHSMHRLLTRMLPAMLLLIASCCIVTRPRVEAQLRPTPDPAFTDGVNVAPPKGVSMDGVVDRVIDGDTLIVRTTVEYRVRLLDCWAPESRTTDAAEKVRGLQAKARLTTLAAGKPVRVFVPIEHGDLSTIITLGRVLGRVWTLNDGGLPAAEQLSAVMVREKLATIRKPEQ